MALLLVVVLTTPLQAAGEELIFRGTMLPAIAFHVCNNLVVTLLNSLFADGGTSTYERSVGAGGPSYLILAAVDLAVVGLVWLCEHGWHRPGSGEDGPH
ncbi:hypothetical protein SAMN04487904_10168 [Actinopolyspora lacussalsi subsp. righensis]|uniref:CAAX protease self-immunity n=1 Tax=Actinopolyspora righensis TaxID=995060 RepID=A0A1I6X2L2_9ACTN|nr:hypothetical protein [Actinopolyspora righensis]SFT32518.1 hypothetical protein SAMN04487904_10168 [Actinopolyspora righensis]